MLSLYDPVSKLHLVKPEHEKALAKLEIKTVRDLLHHFPRNYQDLTEIKKIADIRPAETANIRARVKSVANPGFPFRRVKITEALLEDDSGNVVAIWFNQPYIKNSLRVGSEYYFSGKGQLHSSKKQQALQLAHPTFEPAREDTIHVAGIIPEYPLTEGITQKQIRYWLKQALTVTDLDGTRTDADFLPQELRKKYQLTDIRTAIKNIHFPQSQGDLEAARKRLAFEELFLFQLAFQNYKKTLKSLPAPAIPFNKALVSKFVACLPFELTASQRLAAWEILNDLAAAHPMNRLLEGEVGSGKTVVAGLAMLEASKQGWQSILLAPTEILALQHYETLKKLFAHTDIEIALLTRTYKLSVIPIPRHSEGAPEESHEILHSEYRSQNDKVMDNISSGKIKIIIGTHALLQENVKFKKIGFLVVDEQHRFGVKQRAKLQNTDQDFVPHLLSMTATPIPRTLALAFYGDLDISKLKELPFGRKKVITRLVAPENRQAAYEFIRKELGRGRQAYVIVPLVGHSPPREATPKPSTILGDPGEGQGEVNPPQSPLTRGEEKRSVISETEKLGTIFPEFKIGALHGRMSGEEKKSTMQDFKENKIQILVSTTVVEVGVDVPNATIMIIENAERFGLATLHQLRGRVGRGSLQSLCILFAEGSSALTRERLEAVVNSTDGFELAEIDLRLRGAGEILGARQSGFVPFKIASLSDRDLIETAKKEALLFLEKGGLQNHPALAEKINEISREAHLE